MRLCCTDKSNFLQRVSSPPQHILVCVVGLALWCLLGAAPVAVAKKVTLRWKLKPGQALAYQTTMGNIGVADQISLPLVKMAQGTPLTKIPPHLLTIK